MHERKAVVEWPSVWANGEKRHRGDMVYGRDADNLVKRGMARRA